MNIQELFPHELDIYIAQKLGYYCKIATETFEGSFGKTYTLTEYRIFSPKGELGIKNHNYLEAHTEAEAWENAGIPSWVSYFPSAWKLAEQILGKPLDIEFIEQMDGTIIAINGHRTVLSSLKQMLLYEATSHPSVTDPVSKLADALTRLCAKVMDNGTRP